MWRKKSSSFAHLKLMEKRDIKKELNSGNPDLQKETIKELVKNYKKDKNAAQLINRILHNKKFDVLLKLLILDLFVKKLRYSPNTIIRKYKNCFTKHQLKYYPKTKIFGIITKKRRR